MPQRPPILSTPRLVLRPLGIADTGWLRELSIDREIRNRTLIPARRGVHAWVHALLVAAIGDGRWVIEQASTGTPVGWIGLSPMPPMENLALGFEVRRAFWNQGFATEAAREIVRAVLVQPTLPAISGLVFPDNLASQRIFEKAGFACQGPRRYEEHDVLLYEITAEAWRSRTLEPSNR